MNRIEKSNNIKILVDNHLSRITNLITGNFKKDIELLSYLEEYPKEWKFSRKLYHFINNDVHYICSTCSINELKFKGLKIGYSKYCSCSCRNNSCDWKQKYKNACLQKYGKEYASQSLEFRKQVKNTCMNKYGVESPMQSDIIKENLRKSLIKKYGVDNYSKTKEFPEKLYQTRLKNGTIISRKLKTKLQLYNEQVKNETNKSYRNYFKKIDPDNLKRSRIDFHLDHIFSISEGFKSNISPKIIGHWTNLRMLNAKENSSKNYKSDKTLEQLLNDYEES